MSISFEESLKNYENNVATTSEETSNDAIAIMSINDVSTSDASIMTLDETTAIAAYSGSDGNWMQHRSYVTYPIFYDEELSVVSDTKDITLNRKQFNITQEENSQYIPFEMPRYYDGFDLVNTIISIHYKTKLERHGACKPVNVTYNNERIRFGWLVDAGATLDVGILEFEIHAYGSIVGSDGVSRSYTWKTKRNKDLNVLESLCDCEDVVNNIDDSWMQELITDIAEKVADEIKDIAVGEQVAAAEEAASTAQLYAESAKQYSEESASAATTIVNNALVDYATKQYVDDSVASVDVTEQLSDYVKTLDLIENYYTKSDTEQVISDTIVNKGLATETYVDEAIKSADLDSYYKKDETYSRSEVDEKLSNINIDGYATESYVDAQVESLNTSISTNTTSISSINKNIEDINQTIENIDTSPRVTYDATYGDVELDDGSTAEYMYTLWKTENGVREVQDRFQIMGGGGGGGSVTLRIAYVEGYTTPLVATVDDKVIVKYEFSGEDSAGDTNLDGVASWKVGNRIVATEDVATGECEFDLTDYVSTGDNKVVLTITHATGAVATKAWTVKVVDVRLESTFDDTKVNTANEPVVFTFTPYGGVNKTIYFLLDGEQIGTKTSSAAAAGLSDSFTIPAQEHGTHLFEIYMTADINNKTIESNHIIKDIIWYDESSSVPVISCVQQEFTARQYEATNISYTVYDPSTETPSVSLKATYVNEDGETIDEYSSNITMSSNTATWQYKTDVLGEHTLTITCGETVKTLIATVVELGIEVSPITAGLVFDFNPVGYSNDDDNRLWSDGDIVMTVSENFDWVNGGYQIDENGDQCFCIKAGTSAEINYELFGDDAKSNGKQFKLIFRTENVSDTNATFLSCVSDATGDGKNIGIEMKAQEANIYAKEESLPLPYAEEEIIEFEFNIASSNETIPMVMGYEDGVSTRPMVYDATHDFQQYQGYRVPISLGSDDCDLYIYRFKVYNKSLSDKDILNNFIADARSAEEMISRYDRNQIYKEGVLDPDYLAEMCPDLRIIKLEVPHFTADKDDKVYDENIQSIVECIYKNGDPIYDNWVAYDIVHSGQGTSSNNYGASGRNLDLILKSYKDYGNSPYIVLGDGSKVSKVSLTRESIPVNYFNVKVNIASSENANNALFAKRYNQYNPYNRPFVREDESIIPYIKSTMEFQNAVIFVKESDPDLSTHVEFADNNWHYYALGNIGDSKKTDSSRLTDPFDPYECILEVMDNTLPNSTMPTGKVDENGAPIYPIDPSEWCAGNSAYDSLYDDWFDEKSAAKKGDGHTDDTYGWRYIYEDGTDEENAEVKAYVEQKWKDFYEFVVTSTDEEFKANLGDWVVLDSVMYYYLFTLRYTMTDNHSKNSFWHYGKSNDLDSDGNNIRKWSLDFGYDFDTALGIDNYGRMSYRYGYEEIDCVDGTSDWVWNAPQHVFFLRLRELFDEELCDLYTKLESLGAWSATGLINQFNDWQMQFPEELWRVDIERKYIRTYTGSFINGEAKPEFLKERANGRKKTQRAQFEKNQEKYMSSKFGGTVASADDVILRCSVPNTTLAVTPNFDISLTPYSHMYINVKYNTAPPVKMRAVPNTTYTVEYTGDVADIIEIYSASCLKSIGDLSACYLINGDFSNAKKIRELILGSNIDGYDNTNTMTLGLGSNELLNKLDIQNMSGLSSSLDLSKLKNLKELYATGSSVSGVVFADGGNIEIAEIPAIGSLSMKNLNYLTESGMKVESYSSLTKLVAENSLLDLINIIDNSPNLYQVRLTGVDWTLADTSLLEHLYALAGVSNTGANIDQSVLSGKVFVPIIEQQKYNEYKTAWSDLEITYNTMIIQHPVTFVNYDGTVLDIQYIDDGSYADDPTTRTENPIDIPTKESSVSTEYTFSGWDKSLSMQIFESQIFTAVYSEDTRSYTITYVSKSTSGNIVKQETVAKYGDYVPYDYETNGIPTYTYEESAYVYYMFNRWDKSGLVDGDKTVTAIFDSFKYTGTTSFSGRDLADLSPIEIYALTKLTDSGKSLETFGMSIEVADPYSFTMGYDIDYDDVESNEIISSKTSFDGTNYIDTELKLFEEDRDFIFAMDYTISSNNSSAGTLMQCFQSSGSNGFKLGYNGSGNEFVWGSSSITPSSVDKREMLVIRHKKGDNNLYVYISDLDSEEFTLNTIEKTTTTYSEDATLVFGAGKMDSGRITNYCIGDIHWCKIWYMDLGEKVCEQLAGWTHEEITLGVSGFYRYPLYDDNKKETMVSLVASHLLDREMMYNPTNSNAGGWAESALNKSLNNRFYNAVPTQIRFLLKKMNVLSTVGQMSSDISESGCYVTIPAVYDVDSTQTAYQNELYSGASTIASMSTQQSRRREFRYGYNNDNVDAYESYWLRSPNMGFSSYVWTVNENFSSDTNKGTTSGYNTPNTYRGIVIEISF